MPNKLRIFSVDFFLSPIFRIFATDMAKWATTRGLGGCVAMLLIGIAIEVAVAVLCISVFGMGEGATYCFTLAALCIVLAFAAYYDDSPKPENEQRQEPQGSLWEFSDCPFCLSRNTIIDENGIGYCYDCENYWHIEDV